MKDKQAAREKFGDGDYTVYKAAKGVGIKDVGALCDVDHYATLDSESNTVISIPSANIKDGKKGIVDTKKFTKLYDIKAVGNG